MAEFSEACQMARTAYQAELDQYNIRVGEHRQAKRDLRQRSEELDQARQRLADAEAVLAAANNAWDAHTDGVRAGPDLGVPNVEAGVQPPDAPPAGAAVAGIFQSRQPPNFNAWAAGSAADLSAWQAAADAALQTAIDLRDVAVAAEAVVAQRQAELAAAEAAEQAAREAEQNANAAKMEAKGRVTLARAQVLNVCGEETASGPIGGGGEFKVDPGVLPDDERRVRDRLESLPDEETDGIREVNLLDELGPTSSVVPEGFVSGNYSPILQRINLFISNHLESTLKHEVGHHVHLNRLSDAARARWKAFYETGDNGKKEPEGKMPTDYATVDDGQGFAEVYEHLRDDKALDPEVKRLIEDLLAELN